MTTKNLLAYYLFARNDKNEELSLPVEFLMHISNLQFRDRWDAELIPNNTAVAISSPDWIAGLNHRYFYGKFVEVHLLEKLDLIGQDGDEESIDIPKGKGAKSEFYFIFCPEKQVALIEAKRGCENKIKNFFNRHWEKYKKNNSNLPTLWIESRAITIEDNAREYLKNKSVSNMQLAIDCDKISKDSAFFPLFQELLNNEKSEQIVLNVKISTAKRGASLPRIAMTNFLDIMEQLNNAGELKTAVCQEMIEHRKSTKPTKLIDIHLKKGLFVENENDMCSLFKDELDDLIGELDAV